VDLGLSFRQLHRELIVICQSPAFQGAFHGGLGVGDRFPLSLLRHAGGMNAVLVQGAGMVMDVGNFGEAQAEVVVGHEATARIDAADLLKDGAMHEAKMEGHEFDQELIATIGNLAAGAGTQNVTVGINMLVVGVDQTDVGVGVEDVDGFGQGGGSQEVVAIDPANVGADG